MDPHRLKCFVAVFEKGTVSGAAKALHMTQPPVSILLRKLEEELQVRLFSRESNRLVPTPTGELFYLRAKELLANMESIRRELHESQGGKRGTVRVGCATSASLFIVPSVMQRLSEDGLDITVHVQEGETAYLVQRLRERKLDLVICRSRYTAPDIGIRTVLSEPLMVALPPGHPLVGLPSVSLNDLRHDRFLLHSAPEGYGISHSLIEACQIQGFAPNVLYWGIETLPMLLMVQRGLGVAFAPQSFVRLRVEGLPPLVPLTNPVIETHLSLATLTQVQLPMAAQHFIEAVHTHVDARTPRAANSATQSPQSTPTA